MLAIVKLALDSTCAHLGLVRVVICFSKTFRDCQHK